MRRLTIILAMALFQTLTIMQPNGDTKFYNVTQTGRTTTVMDLTPSAGNSGFTYITPTGRNSGTIMNDDGVGFYQMTPPPRVRFNVFDD